MSDNQDYNDIFLSPPFQFLVGRERTRVTINRDAARGLSKTLDAVMESGQTKGSSTSGTAALEDVEVDVFLAFCEWIYNTDESYTVPIDLGPDASEEDEAVFALRFHLKVYAFATTYLIKDLQDRCLRYMDNNFDENRFEGVYLQAFLDLVEYVYIHTQRAEPGAYKLRNRVAEYIHWNATIAKILSKDGRMTKLLDTYGPLGSDVVRIAAESEDPGYCKVCGRGL